MTVIADNKRRVTLRLAKPEDSFDVQDSGEGKFFLTRLEPFSNVVQLWSASRSGGPAKFGILDRPIDERALQEALADFPWSEDSQDLG